ncbi:MAG: SDR family NAD(P)-dependent oxidoreductase, partial [Actinomycetia bacterium]|nr:SDR family NAD(P)-dependent oxidoreductase [Actinomycetes bacterium]
MSKLGDKVVVITGAAGGIGRATAVRFASEGAAIVAVDLTDDALAGTLAAVDDVGGRALGVAADVTRPAQVTAYIEAGIDEFGGIDVLFNNAGI